MANAAHNAVVLENVARIASETMRIFASVEPMQQVCRISISFESAAPTPATASRRGWTANSGIQL
jgi:hypothetical protein